jgi:uncharacterized protein
LNAGTVAREQRTIRPHQPKTPALLGLSAVLVFTLAPLGRWIAPGDTFAAKLSREALWWASAALVLAWLRFGEQLPFSAIGLRRVTWKSVAVGLLAAALATAFAAFHFAVLVPLLHLNDSAALAVRERVLHQPFWFRFTLVLRAGVVDEILYRGYLIEKVQQLTGRIWLAVLSSVAIFSYAHLFSWGATQLIPAAVSGLVFALQYVWRRDLGSNMIAAFVSDGFGLLTG